MSEECVFCKISKDKENMIHEDEFCYVVPDRYPSDYGHMLVISKEHYENMITAPDEAISHMFIVAKKYSSEAKSKLGATAINVGTNIGREAGQIIYHFHIHVIPRHIGRLEGFMPHKEITKEEAQKLKSLLKF